MQPMNLASPIVPVPFGNVAIFLIGLKRWILEHGWLDLLVDPHLATAASDDQCWKFGCYRRHYMCSRSCRFLYIVQSAGPS
jgi:hypothetical protein